MTEILADCIRFSLVIHRWEQVSSPTLLPGCGSFSSGLNQLSLVSTKGALSISACAILAPAASKCPHRPISSEFWKEEQHLSAFYRQGVEEQRDCRVYLRQQEGYKVRSSLLPKSQITAFHCRTKVPFQPWPSQECCLSVSDVELKHFCLLSGKENAPCSIWTDSLWEWILETPYCWGFYCMDQQQPPKIDVTFPACSNLVRRVTFHECARISGMNSCTCTFAFWLLCMLFMHSPLRTLLFMSNSDKKDHSFIYAHKASA